MTLTDPTGGVGYAFGEVLPSSHMTTIATQQPDALDGAAGGSYTPTAAIDIGGSYGMGDVTYSGDITMLTTTSINLQGTARVFGQNTVFDDSGIDFLTGAIASFASGASLDLASGADQSFASGSTVTGLYQAGLNFGYQQISDVDEQDIDPRNGRFIELFVSSAERDHDMVETGMTQGDWCVLFCKDTDNTINIHKDGSSYTGDRICALVTSPTGGFSWAVLFYNTGDGHFRLGPHSAGVTGGRD